jgi:hypothetical protein
MDECRRRRRRVEGAVLEEPGSRRNKRNGWAGMSLAGESFSVVGLVWTNREVRESERKRVRENECGGVCARVRENGKRADSSDKQPPGPRQEEAEEKAADAEGANEQGE